MSDLRDRIGGDLQLPVAKSAHEALGDLLRRHIMMGTFPIGARLPTERDLAPALGVSRNTARQAVKSLADQGLVRTSLGRNGGSVVTWPEAPSRNRRASILRWRAMMADNYQVRVATAPLAARWAAERATPQQRRAIVKLGATPSTGLGDYQGLESRWQLLVASASCSDLLIEVVSRSREQMFAEVFGITARAALNKTETNWSVYFSAFAADHLETSTAINNADPDGAEAGMRRLLSASAEVFAAVADELTSSH